MKRWLMLAALLLGACGDDEGPSDAGPSDIWDIDAQGVPQFVDVNYIELGPIGRISKYRSSVGHDYSDAFEDCRSMKHYFEPKVDVDWSTVKVFSPIAGVVTRVEQEFAGAKVEIASDDFPAFRFSIFHVNLTTPLQLNDHVDEGIQLGTHVGTQTMSDISVIVNDPTRQGRMVSYVQLLSDQVFTSYMARGLDNRDDVVISRAERDANPLTCEGETFVGTDPLEPWVVLQ